MLLAGLLVFVGIRKVKQVKAPQQTIDTTKDTVTALRQATSHDQRPPAEPSRLTGLAAEPADRVTAGLADRRVRRS